MGLGIPEEDFAVKCHVCGSMLQPVRTDLPFKVREGGIVIIKGLPVLQCENCREYLIEDPVMQRVEAILSKSDETAELEIVRFAA